MVSTIGGFEIMAERCIYCDEDYATHALPMCQMFGDL
jgi:hypothetical protein